MKELNGKSLTLFQVLSNLAYNVFIEVLFLIVLIIYLLIKAVIPEEAIRYLIAFGVFCIVRILQILLETVLYKCITPFGRSKWIWEVNILLKTHID